MATLAAQAKSPRIGDHLERRPPKKQVAHQVAEVRQRLGRTRRRYRGGLSAEAAAYKQLKAEHKAEARALILSRRGRRIHLQALLLQRRQGGQPRWALVDPCYGQGSSNGGYDADGDVQIAKLGKDGHRISYNSACIPIGHKAHNVEPHGGFPALPPRVRELASDPKIRKRAEWVGVLYQPEEWRRVDPDPALIVKWKGIEGYFALAVWGGDRARLMEFVD